MQSVNAATSNNTANTLVKRDASGNFITGAITGNLTGNASTATTATNATNAAIATNATQLGGVAANQYVLTGDPRMTDARNPLPNSANYIQNQNAAPQASTNFNVSGNGTAGGTLAGNQVNAATQFNLGGNRILIGNLGDSNLFVGLATGVSNTTGFSNSFFGRDAGFNNTTGKENSFFGQGAGVGNSDGINNAYFGFNAGYGILGSGNSYFGSNAGGGVVSQGPGINSFFGDHAGYGTRGSGNSFFGNNAGRTNTNANATFNTAIGSNADVGSDFLSNATAIGAGAIVTASNRVQLGRIGLDTTAIGVFGPAGPSLPVCINTSGAAPNVLISCSASSLRYKDDVRPLRQGLSLIQRLRPVTFNWKEGHTPDLGLIAEEVAAIEPLLTTHNTKGEIEGVKYERLNVVLINAVKEQQAQIEAQQKQIDKQNALNKKQQAELDALKALVCSHHRNAAVCKPKN